MAPLAPWLPGPYVTLCVSHSWKILSVDSDRFICTFKQALSHWIFVLIVEIAVLTTDNDCNVCCVSRMWKYIDARHQASHHWTTVKLTGKKRFIWTSYCSTLVSLLIWSLACCTQRSLPTLRYYRCYAPDLLREGYYEMMGGVCLSVACLDVTRE